MRYLTVFRQTRVFLCFQQKYSEKSENIIGLDSYILNSFSFSSPI